MLFHPPLQSAASSADANQQNMYNELCQVHKQLQRRYDELQTMVRYQQKMFTLVKELYGEQVQAATTDPITGLPNHRAVMNHVEEELLRCQNLETSCAILFIDLDHFKQINDTWGHRAGDAILCEVASRLRSALHQGDFVGRYGGEEFVVLLANVDVSEATLIAERLRVCVAAPPCTWEIEDTQMIAEIPVTASIGVAVYRLHGVTLKSLIELADRAMYRAKQTGRNRVCLADLELTFIATSSDKTHFQEQMAVQALRAVSSASDAYTSEHAQRMTTLATAIARKLGCSEEEVQLLRLATLFHDIGKVGISDTLLHKPSSLTPEEWEVMRQHPRIGEQILEEVGGIFSLVARIVVAHHERWDGNGYPYKLAGEAIPISARIICVIDAYDAMTSERSYRQLLSDEEARTELKRCKGSQFDPRVVEAFLAFIEQQQKTQPLPLLDAAALAQHSSASETAVG